MNSRSGLALAEFQEPFTVTAAPDAEFSADDPILFLDSYYYRPPAGVASKDIFEWDAADKQQAADFLNRQVLLDGFKAEVHKVAKKENFWSVAKKYHVTVDTVFGCNPELKGINARAGQSLLMVNVSGTLHQVSPEETLNSLCARYQYPADLCTLVNHIPGGFDPGAGQLLFIPGAKPRVLSAQLSRLMAMRQLFRSPLQVGHYTSYVGVRKDPFTGLERHHNGLDIGAPFNSRVAAAAAGTILEAGWKGGYGKCVVIQHKNGYKTLYGHLDKVMVKVGQKVRRWQFIGKVGMTGRTTGPHLHFTIWHGSKVEKPDKYIW